MTTLYLQRIEISNFRAYGYDFSLSLPGPGVTVLTGPDGLGKRTFFDALEWALTGRVRRLEALTHARRGEDGPVAQYRVSLEFVDAKGESSRMERRAVREQESREQFAEVFSPPRHHVRLTHVADLQSQVQAVVAQGVARKSLLAGQIDRCTHELWMLQSYLGDTTKAIQQVVALDGRIHSVLLAKQEIERCQQAYDEWLKEGDERLADARKTLHASPMLIGVAWEQIPSHLAELSHRTQLELETAQSTRGQLPGLESLNKHQATLKTRVGELSSAIKSDLAALAQVEQELLAANIEQQIASLQQRWLEPDLQGAQPSGDAVGWPVLLLDDSLQHHDLIHSAAFMDGLRNLVRDRKYQVILSTPDEELAEDLRRKMVEAGIECVTCRYRGLGPTGVLYSTG